MIFMSKMLPTSDTISQWTTAHIVPLHEMTTTDDAQQIRVVDHQFVLAAEKEASPAPDAPAYSGAMHDNSSVFALQLSQSQQQNPFINYCDFLISSSAANSSGTVDNNNHQFLFLNNLHSSNVNSTNSNCRSTKSQSKQRRDLINAELNHVRDLLPMTKSSRQRLSQLQVMACNNCYIRKCNYWLTAPLDQIINGYRHDETLYSFEFGKAMSSFYIVCTSNGKLLTIGDNTIDALGQSFEDLLAHGDCIHDLIYREDVLALRSMLELWPDNAIMRTTLVRINPARSVRRQGKYGECKIIFIRGCYTRLTPYYVATSPFGLEPVLMAQCMPLLSPENREVLLHTATELFATLLDRRGAFVGIDERACVHLDVDRVNLIGLTIYDLIEDEQSLREMQQIHRKILANDEEHSVWALLRLRCGGLDTRRSHSTIYVHALLQHQQQPLTASTPAPPVVAPAAPTARKSQRLSSTTSSRRIKFSHKQRQQRSTKSGGASSVSTAVDDDGDESDSGDSEEKTFAQAEVEKSATLTSATTGTTSRNKSVETTLFTLTCQVLSASEALLLQHNRQLIYTSLQTTVAPAGPPLGTTDMSTKNDEDDDDLLDDELPMLSANTSAGGGDPAARSANFAPLPSSAGFVLHDETNPAVRPQFVPAFLPPNNNASGGGGIEDAACASAYLSALGVHCPYVPLPPIISCISQLPATVDAEAAAANGEPQNTLAASAAEAAMLHAWPVQQQQQTYTYYQTDITSTSGTLQVGSDVAANNGAVTGESSSTSALIRLNAFSDNVEQLLVSCQQTNPAHVSSEQKQQREHDQKRRSLSSARSNDDEMRHQVATTKTSSRAKRQNAPATRNVKKLTTRSSTSALQSAAQPISSLPATSTTATGSNSSSKSSTSPTSTSPVKPTTSPRTSYFQNLLGVDSSNAFITHYDAAPQYNCSQFAAKRANTADDCSNIKHGALSSAPSSSTNSAAVVVTAAGTTHKDDANIHHQQFTTLQAATVHADPQAHHQQLYESNPYFTLYPYYNHHQRLEQPAHGNNFYVHESMPCYLISQSQPPALLATSSSEYNASATAFGSHPVHSEGETGEEVPEQPFML